jgi:hypothetical protein
MKKLIILAAVFCMPLFALASQMIKTESPDSIAFEKLVHDYGTLENGANGDCEFVFTNKGEKPLVLSNVRASCGCTAPSWTKEPVLPGKTGVIKVGYNTGIPGVFHKTVTVTSNAANSQVILTIKGNVLPKQ